MTSPVGWQPRRHAHAAGESWRKWGEPLMAEAPVLETRSRYQAHPVSPEEDYELRPERPRRDAIAVGAALVIISVLAFFGSLVDVSIRIP